jgi:hypothetical protein
MNSNNIVNGQRIIEGRLVLPSEGIWTGEFRLDEMEPTSGNAAIQIGSSSFLGTVLESGAFAAQNRCRVIGGKGKLSTVKLVARSYKEPTVKNVLQSIALDSGEVLSPTISPTILNLRLPFWTRKKDSTGSVCVKELCLKFGFIWRILEDGTIWIGYENYPKSPPPIDQDTEELNASREWKYALVGSTEVFPRPLTTWKNRTVEQIIFHLKGDSVRSEVFYGN